MISSRKEATILIVNVAVLRSLMQINSAIRHYIVHLLIMNLLANMHDRYLLQELCCAMSCCGASVDKNASQ